MTDRKVVYVKSFDERTDGKMIISHYTEDKEAAYDFESRKNAESFCAHVVNPFERLFKPVSLEVSAKKRSMISDEKIA